MDRVRELLGCIPIKRVVSVDDRHAPGIEVVLTLARKLSGAERAEAIGSPGRADAFDEFDIFRADLERRWSDFSPERQREIVQAVQVSAGQSDVADDTEALTELKQLMPDNFEGHTMAEWENVQADILTGEDPILVLIDRDFSGEGGAEKDGERLLGSLQEASADKPVWTGLLTHTITPQDEHATYLELTEYLDPHRTVVISKARLKAGEFPAHLRLVLLAPLLSHLVTSVASKIQETHADAITEFKRVLPIELESMVFGASQAEGVWEPDTLLLLFGLMQRDQARERIWREPEVHELTEKIRCLARAEVGEAIADADLKRRGEAEPTAATPRFYQRKQIYEDIETVNRLHLPLECGDVFEDTTKPSKKWILIAQPCDLLVRGDGVRGNFPITHVVIVPLKRDASKDLMESDFRLPYFDDQGRAYVAKLGQPRFQRLCLLDFAVFREDGESVLDIEDESPENTVGGWGMRHTLLRTAASELLSLGRRQGTRLARLPELTLDPPTQTEIDELAAAVLEGLATDHARPPFVTVLDPTARTIDAGCRRVARLSPDYARALLTKWGAHMTRPVLPYDLTRGSS